MADPKITADRPIVTRKQAKASGLTRYFTGKPCKHGHADERLTINGSCSECCREKDRRNYVPRIRQPKPPRPPTVVPETRQCPVCRVVKPSDGFYASASRNDGLSWRCKSCACAASSEWVKHNPEQAKKSRQEWEAANRLKVNANRRAWNKRNPEKVIARRNRQDKARQAAHVKAWVERNPDRRRQITLAHQHKRRDAPGDGFTADDVARLLKAQRYKCAACARSVRTKRHVDHIVAIAKGGRNDVRNIQILCPECNLKKRAKDPIDFMRSLGRLI